jgi:hypothetical protein
MSVQTLIDFDAAPAARRSDPETSHEAAAKVNRTELQAMFASAVGDLQRATAAEVRQYWIGSGLNAERAESVRKRAKEAIRAGLVRICGRRRCGVTGNNAQVYEVVR